MNFKPLFDRVVIKQAEVDSVSKGGIILPDSAKEKPNQGTVVAVGDGKLNDKGERVPVSVSVGNEVLYGKFSGTEIVIEGDDYVVLRETDIIGIIEINSNVNTKTTE